MLKNTRLVEVEVDFLGGFGEFFVVLSKEIDALQFCLKSQCLIK